MRIGELSRLTGASPRSLRYYEEQGLLDSARTASGQRHYDSDHVRRVSLIQAFFAVGMSSRTIAEVVACVATTSPASSVAEHAMEVMTRERARLTAAMDGMTRTRAALDELIAVNQDYLTRQDEGPTGRG